MEATRAAGWYPAPDGAGEQWWNGVGWSESRRGLAASGVATAPPATYSASNPAPQAPGLPLSAVAPRAALTIDARSNPMAIYGLVAGVLAIVLNVLLVPSILAIYFSSKALAQSNTLSAAGVASTLRTPAIIGLVLGILGGVGGLVQGIFFVGSIVAGFGGML